VSERQKALFLTVFALIAWGTVLSGLYFLGVLLRLIWQAVGG